MLCRLTMAHAGRDAGSLRSSPDALTNTGRIAAQCYTGWDFKQTIFPSFRQLSSEAAFETLQRKTYEGARWRYGTRSVAVTERIERELTVIRDKGYADYFLIVDEIVQHAPRTCGRVRVRPAPELVAHRPFAPLLAQPLPQG